MFLIDLTIGMSEINLFFLRFENQFNFLLYIDVHSVKLMKFIICILEQIECVLSLALDNACMAWQRK